MNTPALRHQNPHFLALVATLALALLAPGQAFAGTSTLTTPANGSTLYTPTGPVTFTWTAVSGALTYYLWVGTTAGGKDVINTGEVTVLSTTHAALAAGTYYATMWTKSTGNVWTSSTSQFTVATPPMATMLTPADGSTLYTQVPVNFSWGAASGALKYYLYVGTAPGAKDIVNSGELPNTFTSLPHAALPAGTYYVTLWTRSAAPSWATSTSTFTVVSPPTATLITPANGANVYTTSPVNFSWGAVTGALKYYLYVGTTAGAKDVINSGELPNTFTSLTVKLAAGTYYVTLWTKSAAPYWTTSTSTFTVSVPPAATLAVPANASTISSTSPATFNWDAVNGGTAYYLYVGTSAGAKDVIDSGEMSATSITHAALPVGTYYVTLFTKSSAGWNKGTTSGFSVATGVGAGGSWLPYTVSAVPSTTGGGNGLGVVSSTVANNLLQYVTTSAVNPISIVLSLTQSGGTLTGYSAYAAIYAQLDGSNNWHLYSAQLQNGSTVPTPVQVSSLSLAGGGYPLNSNCVWQAYTNAFDPTTAFFIVEKPTLQPCGLGTGANPYVLVRLSDAAGTAPTALPSSFATGNPAATYSSSGLLTGLVLVDTTKHLDFFAASGFPAFASAPTVLASNVADKSKVEIHSDRTGKILSSGTVVFFDVTNASLQELLYRVSSTGSASLVYTAQGAIDGYGGIGSSSAWDNTNLYFFDAYGTAPVTFSFKKVPIAGTTVTTLYTDSSGTTSSYQLVDSDGSYLIINGSAPATTSYALKTLSLTAVPPVVPATLLSYSGAGAAGLRGFLDFGSDHLFVTEDSTASPPSALVFTPSSSTPIAGQGGAGVTYQQFGSGIKGVALASTVIKFSGVTDIGYGMGGASMYSLNPSTFASTQIKNIDGSNYAVPSASLQYVIPLGPSIGDGAVLSTNGGKTNGSALNVSTNKITTIEWVNSDVTPE